MRRALLLLLVIFVSGATVGLFVTPPEAILRRVGSASAGSIMTGNPSTDTGVRIMAARLAGAYVQTSLAAHIADRMIPPDSSDEEALFRILLLVRDHVLNLVEFKHTSRSWPVLVSGLGYCDQINGAVGVIAARRFDVAQLYALYDPASRISEHTIGRVWSSQRREWLYYDAFWSTPVIFTRGADGSVHFIDVPPSEPIVARGEPDRAIYSLRGWIMSEFQPTFGRFLLVRTESALRARMPSVLKNRWPWTNRASEWTKPEILNNDVPYSAAVNPGPVHVDDEVFEIISGDFVVARLDDLLGMDSQDAYRKIGSDPSASRDDRAANVSAIAARLAVRKAS